MENNNPSLTLHLTTFRNEYFAVFYDSSMILALFEKTRKKELKELLKREMKQNRIPLLQRGQYTKDFFIQFENKYLVMDRETVLRENNDNFEIQYNQIKKVSASPYRTHSTKAHENPPIAGEMTIYTYSDKYHFNHDYKIDNEKIAKIKGMFQDKFSLLK